MRMLVAFLVALLPGVLGGNLYKGAFSSRVWNFDDSAEAGTKWVRFTVALKLRNTDGMHNHFQDVSNPNSANYGKYLTAEEVDAMYGPSVEDKRVVRDFFQQIKDSEVTLHENGDLLQVRAPIEHVEKQLQTKLGVVSHYTNRIPQKAIRAKSDLSLPNHIADKIAFISLNAPVNHIKPRGAKSVKQLESEKAANAISVNPGNEEALVSFQPICSDGKVNNYNPPCSNLNDAPGFSFSVNSYTNTAQNAYILNSQPTVFNVPASNVYCYDNSTAACSGAAHNGACNCLAKLAPLPKYTQLRVNITETLPATNTVIHLGATSLFALTDVATASFLSDLYNIPAGMKVNHGSNQSVAEFYGEFYSNSDLEKFLYLSGLPNNTISTEENYYIDLPNDQQKPGGEAQLDVEYIMALAPGAPTYFYSIGTYNPNDPVNTTSHNEGFLDYLQLVESQAYPPLVHSLSYGDVEGDIFNASNSAAVAYGERCDQEFMQLGLRGLTFLFSSGDDGIGSAMIRDDVEAACKKAVPEWPASSPYVTSVGATMLTDKYLPICGNNYANPDAYPGLPITSQLQFQCTGTGETVCTGTFGGVITSGGGFSDVSNRSYSAPWQEAAVNAYLNPANGENFPPLHYFNPAGRGYPDVATYGSNYFVYLDGQITRESGTSASAPVFAAMVTLWNDLRLAYGQPPMGFIAPFLYQVWATNPEAFHDITTGNNACGVGRSIETAPCCAKGFGATPGWDAVSGLGSPNFQVISNLVLNNATSFPNLGAFPNGEINSQYASAFTQSSNDDGIDHKVVRDVSITAAVLGIFAFILSCALCGYVVVNYRKRASDPANTINKNLLQGAGDP